ncbi:MAG: FtsQ-type POTRA domain-containing protein [Deltaproteobacteria bacterium]|nr:FtsQ-type POTRA domain-containing protein [Deltaproteobacteria bacterium]MBW2069298.1 FtsQ-type POTRA domain-containing protein [Deltaproteobacteria bacterium]
MIYISGWKKVSALLIFLLMAGAGVSIISAFLYKGLRQLNAWKIKSIEVRGNRIITDAHIKKDLGITRGMSIWDIRLPDLGHRLEADPWIEKALVRWNFSGNLVVEVFEKKPTVAICDDICYYIDRKGNLFATCKECPFAKYKIYVESLGEVSESLRLKGEFEDKLKSFLKTLSRRDSFEKKGAIEFFYRDVSGFSLRIDGLTFIMGFGNFAHKFALFERLLAEFEKVKKIVDISTVDLRYKKYALVKAKPAGKEREWQKARAR